MIQVVTNIELNKQLAGEEVKLSTIHSVESFDCYDVNVISLQEEKIWRNNERSTHNINSKNDFNSLSLMIENSQVPVIILFPQNYTFKYYFYSHDFHYHSEIKDMLTDVNNIIGELYKPLRDVGIIYEKNETKLGDFICPSDFCIRDDKNTSVGPKTKKSNKTITIQMERIYLSTLLIDNYDALIQFLKSIQLIHQKEEPPKWVKDLVMFDDVDQNNIIKEHSIIIQEQEEIITKAKDALETNNRYKSILYSSGEQLVAVVFEILEKMLGCNLTNFVDKCEEDFLFKIDNTIFIGEIKGVDTNVRRLYLSQLDRHVQKYLDEHEDNKQQIVALLIIDHQRDKPLDMRVEVMADEIDLAKRYGSLIVETQVLLNMFEKFLSGDYSKDECIEFFKQNTGILKLPTG